MLLRSEKLRLDWEKLNDDVKAGRYSDSEAVPLFHALDPFDATATLLEAKLALQAEKAERAEELLWRALTLQPLRATTYFLLAKVMEETSGPSRMVLKLRWLGLRVLLVSEEIAPADRALLEREYPEWGGGRGLLGRIEEAATALRQKLGPETERQPLTEPFEVLAGFLDVTRGEANSTALLNLQMRPLEFGPVMLGAARDALREPGRTSETTTVLLVAALGVVGESALVPQLVGMVAETEVDFATHAQWALVQMLRRLPGETFEALREVAVGRPAAWRTVVADLYATMPNEQRVTDGLLALTEGLEEIADEADAGYLMVLLERELRGRSGGEAGQRIQAMADSLLHGEALDHHDMYASTGEKFETSLESEKLTKRTLEQVVIDKSLFEVDSPDGFDELEELMEMPDLEPVRRETPKIGRNDACWCGSGKKYKKCHLDADEGRQTASIPKAAESVAQMSHRLFERLSDFSMTVIAREEMAGVALRYLGKPLSQVDEDELHDSGFLPWLMYDYPLAKNGRTVLAEYLRRNKNVLSEREYGLLEARQAAEQGIYEVTDVEPGKGVHLREIYSKRAVYVVEKSASRQVSKGDHMHQRVESFEGVFALSGHGFLVPDNTLEPLLAWVEAERAKSGETAAAFVAGHSPEVRRFVVRLHAAASVQLHDAEGNEFLFSKARYRILDAEALRKGLGQEAVNGRVWEIEGEEGYVWLAAEEDSSGGRRGYGRLSVSGGEAEVECVSRERLAAARADLEARAAGAIEHVEDTFKTAADAMSEAPSTAPVDEIPTDVQRDIVTKYKEEHYRTWPDHSLPALGGKTPRQAAKTPKGVNLLDGLLRDFQKREEREQRSGKAFYDINRLRKELGLKPTK